MSREAVNNFDEDTDVGSVKMASKINISERQRQRRRIESAPPRQRQPPPCVPADRCTAPAPPSSPGPVRAAPTASVRTDYPARAQWPAGERQQRRGSVILEIA